MVLTIFSTVFFSLLFTMSILDAPRNSLCKQILRGKIYFVISRTICYMIFFLFFFSADTKIWTMRWSHVAKYCMLLFIHYNRSINHWIKWVMIIALKAFPCFAQKNRINKGSLGFFFFNAFLLCFFSLFIFTVPGMVEWSWIIERDSRSTGE